MDEKMRTLANDILRRCQEQGLTFAETKLLLRLIGQRVDEGRERAMEEAGEYKLKFRSF